MELRRLWILIWHRKLLIGLLVVAALAAGYQTTSRVARYQAVAVLFVGVPEFNSFGVFSNDLQLGQQQLAATFATMVPSISYAESAIEATGVARSPGQAVSEVSAGVVPGTTLIHVGVTDPDPVVAQSLANGIAQAFVNQIIKIDPVTTTIGGGTSTPKSPASISQPALLPAVPISNGLGRKLVLSGIFGLLFAVGIVLLLDYLDLSVRSPDDLERRVGLPVLGIIPFYPRLSAGDNEIPMPGRGRIGRLVDNIDA